jgi:acyl-[acyl-carrier-protein] desaturase
MRAAFISGQGAGSGVPSVHPPASRGGEAPPARDEPRDDLMNTYTSPVLARVEQHVTDYLRANDDQGYNRFEDFDWSALKESVRESRLQDLHVGAVETAMLVEDHIPGYATEYIRLFAVEGQPDAARAWNNRQMLHFVYRWVAEEDRHAHCLELWLRHCGRRDPAALTDLMVNEGRKHYQVPHEDPTQLFTYTALQEKATQLYYSCLRGAVDEPVLRAVLAKLSQDEARHCHFFSQLVLDALEHATVRQVAEMKEALEQFQMPLAMMMDNYKRKAIEMIRAARGYDYRDALEHYARLVKRAAEARTTARSGNLQELLIYTQQFQPGRPTA